MIRLDSNMTNEEDNGGVKNYGSDCMTEKKCGNDGSQPNGSAGAVGLDGNENNSMAEGSGSDDCGDKLAKESDPLQPKMVKSRSLHKVKEVKEVS